MASNDPTASQGAPASQSAAAAYRRIPSVHQLAEQLAESGWADRLPRSVIVGAARAVIDQYREELANAVGEVPEPAAELFSQRAAAILEFERRPPLAPVINATGIIIHTGLGRAPLAEKAIETLADVARCYAPVELVMATGERGKRSTIVRKLLCDLTGAESATVVNNNTAALLIVLSTLADGRSVIVSRGELIEIGGSFRLPEVIEAGGSILREVGTTNKTRIGDYRKAIDETTGALLRIHTSNYRVEGFTEAASIEELVELGRSEGVPLVHDIGSGVLVDAARYGVPTDEPDAAASVTAGADLVLFSGDKLLGGPQAGIIVGRAALIDRIEKHPMMRAMRVDKLTLASLGATLQIHRDTDQAKREIPILAALNTAIPDLQARAEKLIARLGSLAGVSEARLHRSSAYLGGGTVPAQAIPSIAIEIRPGAISDDELAGRLRAQNPGVVPRVKAGGTWFDLRTVFPAQDEALVRAIEEALGC